MAEVGTNCAVFLRPHQAITLGQMLTPMPSLAQFVQMYSAGNIGSPDPPSDLP